MNSLALLPLLFALSTAALAAEPSPLQSPRPAKSIAQVKEVTLTKDDKGNLTITAKGIVTTGGWTQPQLSPHVYVMAPQDGVYGFTFTAVPPDGMSTQVISPIEAKYIWQNVPANVKGVSIEAAKGASVKMLDATK